MDTNQQHEEDLERPSLKRRLSTSTLANSIKSPPAHFYALRIPDEQINQIKNKAIREFYKNQNEIIDRFEAVDRVIEEIQKPSCYGSMSTDSSLTETNLEQNKNMIDEEMNVGVPLLTKLSTTNSKVTTSPTWIIHLAINLSLVANIALFLTKVLLAIVSGSMAILASAFESFLDILSNAIIFITMRLIRQKNIYAYPVGKSRMEPLGIIVFAVVITTSFSQVLVSSLERLTEESTNIPPIDLSPVALALLGANILIKGLLWIWCLTIKGSSSVQALAQDHENDVVFNIASTIFPVLAVWIKLPWLDAVGAILLSVYIIYEWMIVLFENIRRLTGQAACADDIKQLTYMAYRFSSKIISIETVSNYST
ncbi:uncharacterized protein BX663DRAFT_514213 [Cokeromyces recurvatus]|uniref:uncharacterized protein n=1 Tax=Cokeromyces recurvatus TaxID=90255 RepID=UPI0022201653|nr:uncharacterized protein BX663DRAFT_514213 [Cokeromyces recurvatus]KAI7901359.1 hypothetical protein BX663DRAFT_514213 [Cokeromyces recurvatus]